MNNTEYERLKDIIKQLRDPNSGCPWDLKQTVKTLAPSLLEESCECIDGTNNNDLVNVKEELGDIIFTATLMSYILEQDGITTVSNILKDVNDKMVRRHPHVFEDLKGINTSSKVLEQWEKIKVEKEGRKSEGLLSRIPNSLPPLEKANEIQKKVKKVGFDWDNVSAVFEKINEEILEVKEEIKQKDYNKLELEIGDLLFSVVNLSRFLKIDPSVALSRTNQKFSDRFNYIEKEMLSKNLELSEENFETMDNFWNEAKKLDK